MIGWWLWALSHVGNQPIVVRSLTLLLTTVIAGGIVLLARELLPRDQEPRAWLAGAVYLSMPASWFAVFVTTDTPLIFSWVCRCLRMYGPFGLGLGRVFFSPVVFGSGVFVQIFCGAARLCIWLAFAVSAATFQIPFCCWPVYCHLPA